MAEARYQKAVFRGSEETLIRDFKLRYGDRWQEIYERARDADDRDVENAESLGEELIRLVESRIDDIDTAALYAAYGRNLSIEKELETGMELLGCAGALEKLLRWGLAMHYTDDVVAAPPYLAKLLIRLGGAARGLEIDLWEELDQFSGDGGAMALLEGLLAEELDVNLHEAFYGALPDRYRFGRLASYQRDLGLVVNPAFSAEELLDAVVKIKERKADHLARSLSLHGEYEFNTEARCGLHYLSVDGTVEKSGVVAICPWLSYSKTLWRRRPNFVLVVEGRKPPAPPPVRVGVIFIKGGEAEVVRPPTQSKVFEYLVDVLYASGFSVVED